MYPHQELNNRVTLFLLFTGFFLLVVGIRLEMIQHFSFHIPYWDDYTLASFVQKYTVGEFGWHELLKNVNEHRFILNKLTAIGIYEANQHQWDHRLHMIINSLIWAAVGVFILRLVLNNLDGKQVYLPLLVLVLLWIPPLFLENMLWGVQMHTFTCLLFVSVGLWCVTAKSFSWRWWLGVASLLWAPLTMAHGFFAIIAHLGLLLLLYPKSDLRFPGHEKLLIIAFVLLILGSLTLLGVGGGDTRVTNLFKLDHVISVLKTLSWPASNQVWPALIFALPPMLLLVQLFRQPLTNTRLARFTLTLYGFGVITALGVGMARGGGGMGPALRYYDYLTVLPLASILALAQLQANVLPWRFWKGLSIMWMLAFLTSASWLLETAQFTLDRDRHHLDARETAVLSYLNTGEESYILGKGDSIIPFPRPNDFMELLDNYKAQDLLPFEMQSPAPLVADMKLGQAVVEEFAFIPSGSFTASNRVVGVKRFGEPVIGSFNQRRGGARATGRFQSLEFHLNRTKVSIPYRGYLGYPGTSLTLVDRFSGERYPITVERKGKNAFNVEVWRNAQIRVPKGYYYLEAIDDSQNLWFSFAAPRTIGRLTAGMQFLFSKLYLVWGLGIFLLLYATITIVGRQIQLNQPHQNT